MTMVIFEANIDLYRGIRGFQKQGIRSIESPFNGTIRRNDAAFSRVD